MPDAFAAGRCGKLTIKRSSCRNWLYPSRLRRLHKFSSHCGGGDRIFTTGHKKICKKFSWVPENCVVNCANAHFQFRFLISAHKSLLSYPLCTNVEVFARYFTSFRSFFSASLAHKSGSIISLRNILLTFTILIFYPANRCTCVYLVCEIISSRSEENEPIKRGKPFLPYSPLCAICWSVPISWPI